MGLAELVTVQFVSFLFPSRIAFDRFAAASFAAPIFSSSSGER